jgi:hypothetical protein
MIIQRERHANLDITATISGANGQHITVNINVEDYLDKMYPAVRWPG